MKKNIANFLTVIVLFLGLCMVLLSNHIGGWRAFIVLSPSMEPAIPTGSLVITQLISPKSLKVGDVITFIRPDKTREFITHRIAQISQNGDVAIITTKGDNNKAPDNWILAGGGVVGKLQYSIPYLGYLLSLTKTKVGIVIFILIPSFIILYLEFYNISTLLKSGRIRKEEHVPIELLVILALTCLLPTFSAKPTYSLLSSSVTLANNTFILDSSSENKDCNISSFNFDTGSGSINNAASSCQSSTTITNNNTSNINTTVNLTVDTGNNSADGNLGPSTITTGNITTNVTVNETSNSK